MAQAERMELFATIQGFPEKRRNPGMMKQG